MADGAFHFQRRKGGGRALLGDDCRVIAQVMLARRTDTRAVEDGGLTVRAGAGLTRSGLSRGLRRCEGLGGNDRTSSDSHAANQPAAATREPLSSQPNS